MAQPSRLLTLGPLLSWFAAHVRFWSHLVIDRDKYASAIIVARRDPAPDLFVIRIRIDAHLEFRSGQYVTLGLYLNGKIIERPYSISSSPAEDEVELFIERVPSGELSDPLSRLDVGSEVIVRRRTKGLFLRETPTVGGPQLFVATVTGIAPFVSLVRSVAARARSEHWSPGPIIAIQGAARFEELGYAEELTMLQRDCDWFTYIPTVSRPWEDLAWVGELGRVEDVLRKHADAYGVRPGNGEVFLCGHPGMIAAARAIMRRAGFGDVAIHEEQYWPE